MFGGGGRGTATGMTSGKPSSGSMVRDMDEAWLSRIEARALAAVRPPARHETLTLLSDLCVSELVGEVRRLHQLLFEYGRHSEGCNAQWGDTYRCRCGWRDVEREFLSPAENVSH
jgi:hypothetical protein